MNVRLLLGITLTTLPSVLAVLAADLRIGIIGLDTSHVVAFTKLINDSQDAQHVAGGKVVAAYPGGSPDIESSASRIGGYTRQLRDQFAVQIVDSIPELCDRVDAVLLESLDGRPHLAQVRPVLQARKPVFIDKPVAGSLADVVTLFALAKQQQVPVFSSSAYRFYKSLADAKNKNIGELKTAISYGPAALEPHHPDLFWYGIHPVEALFTVMGPACESVVRTSTTDSDVVTGLWSGDRLGTLIGLRSGPAPHKVVLFGSKGTSEQQGSGDYAPLVREIMKFFQTGVAPVSPEETLRIYAFMEAADESKRQGGAPVKISDVLRKAGGQSASAQP